MIITCTKCSTRFNLDDSLVKEDGSKCRCSVCRHIFTAYPLSQGLDPWISPPREKSILEPAPWEMEPTPEESSHLDFESDLKEDDLFEEMEDFEINDPDFSSTDSELEIKNPYLDMDTPELSLDKPEPEPDAFEIAGDDPELGIDIDFPFDEDIDEMEDDSLSPKKGLKESPLALEADEFESIEADLTYSDESLPFEAPEALEDPVPSPVEKKEPGKEAPIILPDPDKVSPLEPPALSKEKFSENDDGIKKTIEPEADSLSIEKPAKPEKDLAEEELRKIEVPPKKEKKVIVKPKPVAGAKPKPALGARPKPKKEKKKSRSSKLVLILLLIVLLGLAGYIASVIMGYKLPAVNQYIKKPVPQTSEVKPVPNQKSVNGRFVTNATAGTLFVITGRVENPSNTAYSHIEIRGALITKNKEEAKIKNVFCGNIITEDMLKTGNISDINALLMLKQGAHNINVNVAPGASVPFMVVFSDLPEKLQNFTVKIAGFDKAN